MESKSPPAFLKRKRLPFLPLSRFSFISFSDEDGSEVQEEFVPEVSASVLKDVMAQSPKTVILGQSVFFFLTES